MNLFGRQASLSGRLSSSLIALALIAALLLGNGCKPKITAEQKAQRTELRQAMREQSHGKAVEIARHILQETPRDNGTWDRLVRAELALGDLAEANRALGEWHKAVRKNTPKRFELTGDIAMQEGNAAAAAEAWSKALRSNPKNQRVLKKLARSYREQQQWPEEAVALSAMLALDDSAATRMLRALCRRQQHRWSEAFEDMQRALQLAPETAEIRQSAKLFERLEKFLAAIRELDARIALTPEDDQLVTDRALLFLRSDDLELALRDADAAAKIAPWAVRPKLFHAIVLEKLGRADEVQSLGLGQTVRLERLTPEFLETIARLDSEISVERNNAELYVARAWQCNDAGQPTLALEDVRVALEKDPASASAYAEGSYALAKLGRADEAYAQIKRATELDGNFVTAWNYRGELEMARGDYQAAVESLSRALALSPSPAALQKREECYVKLGLLLKAEDDHRALEALK